MTTRGPAGILRGDDSDIGNNGPTSLVVLYVRA
jgi:hypothetical protein